MKNYWTKKTFLSRINDPARHERYAAGSPDSCEIGLYKLALSEAENFDTSVVLGMTPELRNLAATCFNNIITIDENEEAIELFRDWLSRDSKKKENIINGSWFDLEQHITKPVDAVLGDGVFGNLPNLACHQELLSIIARLLHDKGRFVTRKALIPKHFNSAKHDFETLLQRFRCGEIDDAEFGFGMRLVGHYSNCYNQSNYILDNAKIFANCEAAYRDGLLKKDEIEAINRYYFSGKNCILPQEVWEDILTQEGFDFRIHQSKGKSWYEYYIIYECFKAL